MAGFILLIMGFARMGTMIKYIPYPVTVGFTSGIAVLIFSTQIKDFFGLQLEKPMPADFLDKITVFATHLDAIAYPTLGLAVASFLIIMYWPKRLARWVPGSIAALVLATSLVWLVQSGLVHLPFQFKVNTIGSRFGGIPQSLPFIFQPSIGITSETSFAPLPPSRFWRPSNRCSAAWWPTA